MRRYNRFKKNKFIYEKMNIFILTLFSIIVCLLSVGYSALSTNFKISAEASVRPEYNIRISNAKYYESQFDGDEEYDLKYSKDTLKTGIYLPNTNSSITYTVSVTNYTNIDLILESISSSSYSNDNISYTINETLPLNVSALSTIDIQITFSYKTQTLPDDKYLNSILKFNFKQAESILMADASTTSLRFVEAARSNFESITFVPNTTVPSNAIESCDASSKTDNSVIAWYTDTDNNGLYEMYIGGYGKIILTNGNGLFKNYTNVKNINFTNKSNSSESYVDTSNITTTAAMFSGCAELVSLDLFFFDTTNVVDMQTMFENCKKLTTLNVTSFNTKKVKHAASMFKNCSLLEELDVSGFNMPVLNYSYSMFYGCSKVKSLDVSNFNAVKVSNANNMFAYCSGLEEINLNGFNLAAATNLSSFFAGDKSLKSVDLTNFGGANATTLASFLNGCSSLTEVIGIENINFSKVTALNQFFNGCSSLKTFDLSRIKAPNATTVNSMFRYCYALESINLENINFPKLNNISALFDSCTALKSANLNNFNTNLIENMSRLFYGCKNLTEVNMNTLDLSKVKSMANIFYNCNSILKIDLSNLVGESLTDMSAAFSSCYSLQKLDLSNLKNTTITTIGIYKCSSLEQLFINNFDFSNTSLASNLFKSIFPNNLNIYILNATISDFSLDHIKNIFSSLDGIFTFYVSSEDFKSNLALIAPNVNIIVE